MLDSIRVRQWLSWHHLVALRGVVYKDRFHGGNLLQVRGLQPFINVLVGMMCPSVVIEIVLDELKSRNPHRIKAQVVGSTGVALGYGRHAKVFQGRDPLREDGCRCRVALGVDPGGSYPIRYRH